MNVPPRPPRIKAPNIEESMEQEIWAWMKQRDSLLSPKRKAKELGIDVSRLHGVCYRLKQREKRAR